jgi:hypothetical protein
VTSTQSSAMKQPRIFIKMSSLSLGFLFTTRHFLCLFF